MTLPHSPQSDPEGFHTPIGSRRTFFRWVSTAIASFIGLSLSIPLVGYVISPAFSRREKEWQKVATVDELPVNDPQSYDYRVTVKDGWLNTKATKAVWVIKRPDDSITVFSPLCTHLGCGFQWDRQHEQFKCPCHGSVFDQTGQVLAGPAPRPLDVLPSKVENGALWVLYKEFQSGLTKQVEL